VQGGVDWEDETKISGSVIKDVSSLQNDAIFLEAERKGIDIRGGLAGAMESSGGQHAMKFDFFMGPPDNNVSLIESSNTSSVKQTTWFPAPINFADVLTKAYKFRSQG
jgi:hypothetical protein